MIRVVVVVDEDPQDQAHQLPIHTVQACGGLILSSYVMLCYVKVIKTTATTTLSKECREEGWIYLIVKVRVIILILWYTWTNKHKHGHKD